MAQMPHAIARLRGKGGSGRGSERSGEGGGSLGSGPAKPCWDANPADFGGRGKSGEPKDAEREESQGTTAEGVRCNQTVRNQPEDHPQGRRGTGPGTATRPQDARYRRDST